MIASLIGAGHPDDLTNMFQKSFGEEHDDLSNILFGGLPNDNM